MNHQRVIAYFLSAHPPAAAPESAMAIISTLKESWHLVLGVKIFIGIHFYPDKKRQIKRANYYLRYLKLSSQLGYQGRIGNCFHPYTVLINRRFEPTPRLRVECGDGIGTLHNQ
uniref:Uncharacterized protein n=1 Tax=Cacopsylla melanoneura TaxID=428564 RepID=A0A8D9F4W9_9HEMI